MENLTHGNVDDFIDDYEKSKEKSTKLSGTQKLAKVFTPRSEKEKIRVVKQKDVKNNGVVTIQQEAHFHVLNINKQYRKIYCLKHNDGKECPLCNKYEKLLATQKRGNDLSKADKDKNSEIFKNAVNYQAKKFYILKIVDFGSLKDGVKFWRFKHNFKQEGVKDMLIDAVKRYKQKNLKTENPTTGDFTDLKFGCDLEVNTKKKTLPGKSFEYVAVSSIYTEDPSELSENIVKILEPELTWRNIWEPTKIGTHINEYDYLKLCAEGNAPFYDKDGKKWYVPNHPELEEKLNNRDQNVVDENVDEDDEDLNSLSAPAPQGNGLNIDKLTSELSSKTNVLEDAKKKEESRKPDQSDYNAIDSLDDLPF